jgi:hypothetical protein
MVDVDMNPTPSKVIGREGVYELEVFMSYQRILDPKSVQTLERRRSKKKKGFCESERWKSAS